MKLLNKAVFLDRDGTINTEKNYLYKIEDFQFIQGAPESIKLLNDNGFKVIVVTNQSGVARGYYREDDIVMLHEHIDKVLQNYGAHIDAYYYCPHHPDASELQYKVDCNCRKPNNGMLLKAIEDLNIDISKSWIVGDKISDIESGESLNLNGILVKTGHGEEESKDYEGYINENLLEAVKGILENKG